MNPEHRDAPHTNSHATNGHATPSPKESSMNTDFNTDVERLDEEIATLLTSALAGRTAQVNESDLRPSPVPSIPNTQPARIARVARSRWLRPVVTSGAIAAVAASILLAGQVGPGRTGPGQPIPSDADPAAYVVTFTGGRDEDQHLTVSFTDHNTTVPDTAATTTYPSVTVTGGSSEIQDSIQDAVATQVTAEIDAYRRQLIGLDETARPLTQSVTVRSDAQWGHTVEIVLDVVNDFGGAVPSNSSTSVVVDRRTGNALGAADLFTDVSAVDAIMRTALRAATEPAPATPKDVAALTMTPGVNGLTTPLTWYPTEDGLTWVVDRGAIASDAQGEPTATVPWSALAGVIAPDPNP